MLLGEYRRSGLGNGCWPGDAAVFSLTPPLARRVVLPSPVARERDIGRQSSTAGAWESEVECSPGLAERIQQFRVNDPLLDRVVQCRQRGLQFRTTSAVRGECGVGAIVGEWQQFVFVTVYARAGTAPRGERLTQFSRMLEQRRSALPLDLEHGRLCRRG